MSSINLADIAKPVEREFLQVKELLKSEVSSEHSNLRRVATHLLSLRGKMLRPLLSLLIAKLFDTPSDRSISVAATYELIHNATLIHDDVIDEAYYRHGRLTPGAMLRSHSAVIVGDFLFSKGLSLAYKVKAYPEIDIAIQAIEALVEGELRQARNVETLQVNREEYYTVINLKTSSLLAAAAKAGAVSVGASEEQQMMAFRFGECIGSAFQIQDDILDYTVSSQSGKRAYNDIKERKITLPLILAMEVGGRDIMKAFKRGDVAKVAAFVERYKGVELAAKECDRIIDSAIDMLSSFADSDVKESLILAAKFSGNRNK